MYLEHKSSVFFFYANSFGFVEPFIIRLQWLRAGDILFGSCLQNHIATGLWGTSDRLLRHLVVNNRNQMAQVYFTWSYTHDGDYKKVCVFTCVVVLWPVIIMGLGNIYDVNQCIADIFGMSAKKCKTSSVETERLKGTPWDETFSMLSILKI